MAESIYDGSGIDTSIERAQIEYNPRLSYEKPTVLADFEYDEYRADEIFVLASMYSPELAMQRISAIATEYSRLVTDLDSALAADVVAIDPAIDPEASAAIKAYCAMNRDGVVYNDDKVSFAMYKRALGERDSGVAAKVINIYENYHAGPDGRIEAEAYRTTLESSKHWQRMQQCLLGMLSSVSVNKDSSRADTIARWENLEKRRQDLLTDLEQAQREHGPSSYYALSIKEQLSRLNDEIEFYRSESGTTIGIVANQIANDAENSAYLLKDTLKQTLNDRLGGAACCLIRNLITGSMTNAREKAGGSIGADPLAILSASQNKTSSSVTWTPAEDDQRDLIKIIEGAVETLKVIQLALMYLIYGANINKSNIMKSLLGMLEAPVAAIQAQITSSYTQMRSLAMQPIIGWLKSVAGSTASTCMPFEDLCGFITGYVENIDKGFRDALKDMFSFNKGLCDAENATVNGMRDKEHLRSLYRVVTEVINRMESFIRAGCIGPVEARDPMQIAQSIIKNAGWDYTYDSLNSRVKKLEDFICSKE